MPRVKTTKKLPDLIGTERWISPNGKEMDLPVLRFVQKDFNFHKVWLHHVIHVLEIAGNQKIRLISFLIEQAGRDNKITLSQRAVVTKYNQELDKDKNQKTISLFTVRETFAILQKTKFLLQLSAGVYQINPDFLFKGSHANRMRILLDYAKNKEPD